MKQLPILPIVKEALSMPLSHPMEILKAIALMVVAFLVAALVAGVIFAGLGTSPEAMQEFERGLQSGDMEAILAVGLALIPAMLVMGFLLMMAFAHIFNFWVRAGAFGIAGAKEPYEGKFGAAAVNALKFLFITILLVIVGLLVSSVFGMMGLTPTFSEQMEISASGDLSAATRAGLLNQIISTLLSAGIYSYFSANLTRTALGSDREGMQHPHTLDFGIVLILLYAVIFAPVTIAGLMGLQAVTIVLNFALGIFIMLAVGVAHGLRYRICAGTREEQVFD